MPTDDEFRAYNKGVIAEFRANGGVVAQPPFPILLLTTTGARTGRRFTTPTAYGVDGDRVYVVGSKGGGPADPLWYRNLLAHPEVTVELGTGTYEATAVPVLGEERDRLFALLAERLEALREYTKLTTREIPVVVLQGVPAPW